MGCVPPTPAANPKIPSLVARPTEYVVVMSAPDERSTAGELAEVGIDAGSAVAGALVGFAIGGPIGAAVGAVLPPLTARSGRVIAKALAKRNARIAIMVEESFARAGITPEEAISRLEDNDALADHFIQLVRTAADSDPTTQAAFTAVFAQSLRAQSTNELERLSLVADSLKSLRPVHVRILLELEAAGGEASARSLADAVGVPEIELRGAVRGLELQGMIKDVEIHPMTWRLRELGEGVVRYCQEGTR